MVTLTVTVRVSGAEKKNPSLRGRGAGRFGCWSRAAIPGMLTLSYLDLATVGGTGAWG